MNRRPCRTLFALSSNDPIYTPGCAVHRRRNGGPLLGNRGDEPHWNRSGDVGHLPAEDSVFCVIKLLCINTIVESLDFFQAGAEGPLYRSDWIEGFVFSFGKTEDEESVSFHGGVIAESVPRPYLDKGGYRWYCCDSVSLLLLKYR